MLYGSIIGLVKGDTRRLDYSVVVSQNNEGPKKKHQDTVILVSPNKVPLLTIIPK